MLRNQLEELRRTGESLMPGGLKKDIIAQQLTDLISDIRQQDPNHRQRTYD